MSKLRKAAQAVVGCMDTHGFVLQHRIESLRDALMQEDALTCLEDTHRQVAEELGKAWPEARADEADQQLCAADLDTEYELWGAVAGAPGGRWSVTQVNPEAVWPTGVALYVRRVKE